MLACALIGSITINKSAAGQIIPDATLGEENSVVREENIKGLPSDVIEGGASRGNNLFHSFSEFNVGEGRGAYFVNPAAIKNIFSRVTGGKVSEIMGTLGVLGEANLFLINPNGIIFGPNASLDLRGSFVGSTADSLTVGNIEFSSKNPEAPPLLTVNVPTGFVELQFGDNPGNIAVEKTVELKVEEGKTLALVGGNVTVDNGSILARGGQVELGGLKEAGIVRIEFNGNSNVSYPQGVRRSPVSLTNGTQVNVQGAGGGAIGIKAADLIMTESTILAGVASGEGEAGNIVIDTTESIILDNSFLSNNVELDGVGKAGNLVITTTSLELINGSKIASNVFGEGDGGSIKIEASEKILLDGEDSGGNASEIFTIVGDINTFVPALGNSGDIEIKTGSLEAYNGAQINTIVLGEGNAGTVKIEATENIFLDGESGLGFNSGVQSTTLGTGNTGEIEITTGSLELRNGGFVSTNVLEEGNAGTIKIEATEKILVDGENSFFLPSVIQGANLGVGDAGGIEIKTGTLEVLNGALIDVSVFGEGDAGTIKIEATEKVLLDGESNDAYPSSITSTVQFGGVGNAGGIEIKTGTLEITNGAAISSGTFGEGDAGTIKIEATEKVFLEGEDSLAFASGIFSQVRNPGSEIRKAGGIEITTGTLEVRNGAFIDVSILSGKGDAGTIKIEATEKVLLDISRKD